MSDAETIAVYDEQVEKYAKCVNTNEPNSWLKDFVKLIPEKGYILDLGCGPANASAFMRDAGLRVDPVDASAEMVKRANETYDIGARQALFDEISAENKYNGIWANFSLLHAPREKFPKHLLAMSKALKPEGIFHIGLKLGSGSNRDHLGRFYTFYEEVELLGLLADAGFEKISSTKGKDRGLAGTIDPWITILSRKT